MAHGEEIRILRTWTNASGKPTLIRELDKEELLEGLVRLINEAVKEEFYEKGGPQKFKNSWQSYVERAYWDFCQACFVKGIEVEILIKETSEKMYKKLQENPPKRRERKRGSLSLNSGSFWQDSVPAAWPVAAPEVAGGTPMTEVEGDDIYPPIEQETWHSLNDTLDALGIG